MTDPHITHEQLRDFWNAQGFESKCVVRSMFSDKSDALILMQVAEELNDPTEESTDEDEDLTPGSLPPGITSSP